jgi:hypothetical protein
MGGLSISISLDVYNIDFQKFSTMLILARAVKTAYADQSKALS